MKRTFLQLEEETRTFDVKVLAELFDKELLKQENEKYLFSGIELTDQDNIYHCYSFMMKEHDFFDMNDFLSVEDIEKFLNAKNAIILSEFSVDTSKFSNEQEARKIFDSEFEKNEFVVIKPRDLSISKFKKSYLVELLRQIILKRREYLSEVYYNNISENEYDFLKHEYISYTSNNKLQVLDIEKYDFLKNKIFNSQYDYIKVLELK